MNQSFQKSPAANNRSTRCQPDCCRSNHRYSGQIFALSELLIDVRRNVHEKSVENAWLQVSP